MEEKSSMNTDASTKLFPAASSDAQTTMTELLISLGIEALTICPKKSQTEKHCNFCMMTSSFVSPSPASNCILGDYIGMESCFDFYSDNQVCGESRGKREQPCPRRVKKREFPPPISWLCRIENGASRMPMVLKRYYTDDGRLILRKEKREYLKAHRSNGRLTLHLVPLNDIDEEEEEDVIPLGDIDEAKEEDPPKVFDSNRCSNIAETLLKENEQIFIKTTR
ncbi:uncharacterized protein LOC120124996 [Hibiscus syriacus]|uniref:uncharacterized protein LOC120124996 n=1 Tax=Hibiscus syriacus TaxID=106335 RepID=UPI001922A8DD|nr:uncharacterized protein LOC120124996 [Hibiscus syriacus]